MKKRFFAILITAMLLLSGCGSRLQGLNAQNADKKPLVTLEMDDGSAIVIELYPALAPNTVANFVTLSQSGFYNGLTFHRAVEGFMVQGGDPQGNGRGGPGYAIKGEFKENEFDLNTLSHLRGVVSMARSSSMNSGGSQFFIMVSDLYADMLDGKYAAFGKVIQGIDAVDGYSELPIKDMRFQQILEPPVIQNVVVQLNGYVTPTLESIEQQAGQ